MPSCAGAPLPAAGAVKAAARPPARPSRQLPPGDVPSCVRVCVSKQISSPPSLEGAGGTGSPATSCRVAASPHPPRSLPIHPAPTPPGPSPPPPAPPPAAAPELPKAVEKPLRKGRRRVGKEAQVSSAEMGAHARAAGCKGRAGLRQRRREERICLEAEVLLLSQRSPHAGSGAAGQQRGREAGSQGSRPTEVAAWGPCGSDRSSRTRKLRSLRDSVSEELRPVFLR